ncbi:MAG TPA: hypothetical protein VKT72_10370 [Candidatus Baltobacteraceae bacterium]|nr:hypothetical protein [Candidatus Baltobacteraceae bacterium]
MKMELFGNIHVIADVDDDCAPLVHPQQRSWELPVIGGCTYESLRRHFDAGALNADDTIRADRRERPAYVGGNKRCRRGGKYTEEHEREGAVEYNFQRISEPESEHLWSSRFA